MNDLARRVGKLEESARQRRRLDVARALAGERGFDVEQFVQLYRLRHADVERLRRLGRSADEIVAEIASAIGCPADVLLQRAHEIAKRFDLAAS